MDLRGLRRRWSKGPFRAPGGGGGGGGGGDHSEHRPPPPPAPYPGLGRKQINQVGTAALSKGHASQFQSGGNVGPALPYLLLF